HLDLAVQRVAEQAAHGVENRHAGLVAGRLDAQDRPRTSAFLRFWACERGRHGVRIHGSPTTKWATQDYVGFPCLASKPTTTSLSSSPCAASSAPAKRPAFWPKRASASSTKSRPRSASARPPLR